MSGPSWRASCRRRKTDDSQSATAISNGMKSSKKKPTNAKLRSWRVSILRSRAHNLGSVEAPDERAAEAFAVRTFGLSEDHGPSGSFVAMPQVQTFARCSGLPPALAPKHVGREEMRHG
jgi:hypothetical protein